MSRCRSLETVVCFGTEVVGSSGAGGGARKGAGREESLGLREGNEEEERGREAESVRVSDGAVGERQDREVRERSRRASCRPSGGGQVGLCKARAHPPRMRHAKPGAREGVQFARFWFWFFRRMENGARSTSGQSKVWCFWAVSYFVSSYCVGNSVPGLSLSFLGSFAPQGCALGFDVQEGFQNGR